MTEEIKSSNISRRSFLRNASFMAAGLAVGASCTSGDKKQGDSSEVNGGMTYRLNHNTGDSVSILGYGCMRLPTVSNESAQQSNQDIDQEAVNEHVDYAMAHGVNYYDSSPRYCRGRSEAVMGEALSRHPRDKYFIATKLSNFDKSVWSREKSIEMFEQSLKNFRTDYIDYYLLHSIGNGGLENMRARYVENGMIEYCKQKREEGVIRNLGFSYHGDIACFNELIGMHDRGEVHWDFVQIQLNYINWEYPAEDNGQKITAKHLYDELVSRNIPIVIMEPLLGGTLASVPVPVATSMAQRRPDDSPAAWAFRYAAMPGVLTVLSGMTYMDHLKENIATYSPLDPITVEEDRFLMNVARQMMENDTVPCTKCAYCMPCPYGIDIPTIFAHYNKSVTNDNVPVDARDLQYAEARRKFLIDYDRKVDRLRQADHCISCGHCLSKCPQSIAIPEQLARIDRYVESLRQTKA